MQKDLVAGLPFNEEGNVLLEGNIKHESFRITPIGGKHEEGETPEEALAREFWEEYRLRVEETEKIDLYPTRSKGEGDFEVVTFECAIVDGSSAEWEGDRPVPRETEKASHADWFSREELNWLNAAGLLAPNLKLLLETLQDNYRKFFLGNICAEIDPTLTLLDLLQWFRTKMEARITLHKQGKLQLDTFLLANETPTIAARTFNLARALQRDV
ncbi:hypothetical protein COU76_03975 [Candidatus Peregrinibacteria bacterium CG10_big_fil_rev_8_21_14_0_10_49_10]|nr:MAG: hypothetical protein COU76_03975 [Candidatus Peregrinibacteria bacterium CG10_big_fil_rev_8_21_14_0_10_49_10]